jgi:cytochrome b
VLTWFTDGLLWLHTWCGYLAATLVAPRVLWGFIGPEDVRLGRFVRGPHAVFDYLAGLVRFSSRRYVAHSPTGGAMILALLVMIAATTGTGMASLAAMGDVGRYHRLLRGFPYPARWVTRRPHL